MNDHHVIAQEVVIAFQGFIRSIGADLVPGGAGQRLQALADYFGVAVESGSLAKSASYSAANENILRLTAASGKTAAELQAITAAIHAGALSVR